MTNCARRVVISADVRTQVASQTSAGLAKFTQDASTATASLGTALTNEARPAWRLSALFAFSPPCAAQPVFVELAFE